MSRKLLKKELEQRVQELEQSLAESQKALAACQEKENRALLFQKVSAIPALAGNVAHDFNNILGIILGNTELALNDLPQWDPAHVWLVEIKTASLRAQRIVRQMLAFSKNIADRKGPVHFKKVVENAISRLAVLMPSTVHMHPLPDMEQDIILADPAALDQALRQACTAVFGGRQPSPPEKLHIRLEAATLHPDQVSQVTVAASGNYACLRVFDDDNASYDEINDAAEGPDADLSAARTIIEDHGGVLAVQIPAKSTPVLEILLPLVDVRANKSEATPSGAEKRGSERILFVDDEIALVRLGKQMLSHYGYTVTTFINPLKALEEFRAHPDHFDLVITDLTMPQMTGNQLIAEMVKIRPTLPVIVCSGHSDLIDSEVTDQPGIKAFFAKPIRMIELKNKVWEVLNNQ
ncbi:MAG: response regulator [Desulfobacterales bacterium]